MERLLILVVIFLGYTQLLYAQQTSDDYAPELGPSTIDKSIVSQPAIIAKDFMVVTAHPLATQAAYAVLEAGGNAIDAMVTTQTVLGLVEPQSSGLGGGAFLVYYDAKEDKLTTFDGRETAPIKAQPELFLDSESKPLNFFEAVVGGRSVGTPGTVKLLTDTHALLGNLSWATLLEPSAKFAEQGFKVTDRLANALKRDKKHLSSDQTAYDYFFPEGEALKPGHLLKNPEYAKTIRTLAKHGGNYFYNGKISRDIVKKVTQATNPGHLSQKDFSNYKLIEREALCSSYRSYEVCGMGPPSSGAIAVSQTLGILEPFELSKRSPDKAETWQIIADASRLAFADRGLYVADPDFVKIPQGLLDSSYLHRRAKLIVPGKALNKVVPGKPDPDFIATHQAGYSLEIPSTSHFVIVDKNKNIVSMTSTIENGFGSRLMTNGFLLNNELTDFSFRPTKEGKQAANRVQAGKRPRSSMAPTIVFKLDALDKRKPYLALGSPGGSRIINYVSNSLIGILDWNKTPQEAFDQAHVVNRFGTMDIEENSYAQKFAQDFENMGFKVSTRNLNSGLHGILFTEKGMLGGADKRREGLVLGR